MRNDDEYRQTPLNQPKVIPSIVTHNFFAGESYLMFAASQTLHNLNFGFVTSRTLKAHSYVSASGAQKSSLWFS